MKYFFIAILILLTGKCLIAQQDSLAFAHAQWTVKKLARGVKLKQCWFSHNLFGANQNISLLEIKLNRKNRLDVEAEPQTLQATSVFGSQHDALAAINGNFFDMKNGGSVDYIRMDGKTMSEARLGKSGTRAMH